MRDGSMAWDAPAAEALVRALGLALLHSLWQCALVGLLAWAALRLLRAASPQARYAVACTALAACVLWPALELWRALATVPAAAGILPPAGLAADAPRGPWFAVDGGAGHGTLDTLLPWLVACWAAGAAAMALRLAAGLRWVARLRGRSGAVADASWQARLDRLARRFGLTGVRLAICEDADGGPVAIGLWRPMVLVPASLLARMPVEMLEALLAHELAHVRRHDYLVNLLQRLAETVLFHHPAAWWLSHRIRIERELVADRIAADVLGEPRRLALALVELERVLPPTPSLAQAAHGGHLMSRIQSLLRPERRPTGATALLPLAGLALAGIGCFAYAQSMQPGATIGTTTGVAATPRVVIGAIATASGGATTGGVEIRPSARAGDATTAASGRALASSARHDGYALIRAGRESFAMSGHSDDIDAIRAARTQVDGDFLWFRRDGAAYTLRDPALLARIDAAWADSDRHGARMEALGEEMQVHSARMEAIGTRMEAVSAGAGESAAMRRASLELQDLARQQAALAQARAMAALRGADTAAGRADEAADDARMAALDARMQTLSDTIEAEAGAIERRLAPMPSMQAEMERASAPMEALGKRMEALGAEQERYMAALDRKVRALIDEAMAKGLATPAPARD